MCTHTKHAYTKMIHQKIYTNLLGYFDITLYTQNLINCFPVPQNLWNQLGSITQNNSLDLESCH